MEPAEQEFTLEQYPPEYVVVGDAETMPSVLERVEDAWSRSPNAVLIIPRGTLVFRNTHDFLALGKLQDSREVRVSIASHDPIVTGLAKVLGFYLIDPPPDHPALANEPVAGSAPGDAVEQATTPLPLGAIATTQIAPDWVIVPTSPPTGSTTSTWLNSAGDVPIYPAIVRRPWTAPVVVPAPSPHTPQPHDATPLTEQLLTVDVSGASLHMGASRAQAPAALTPTGRIKARRVVPDAKEEEGARFRYGGHIRQAVWGRLLAFLLIALLVLLVGGSAYAYVYLPEGSVSVTPLSRTITDQPVEINVITSSKPGQAGAAGDAPTELGPQSVQTGPTINASWIHSPLTEEGARPASGSRQVLRGRGQGTMHFTNRTGNPVNVPSGMQFKAPNGVTVQVTRGGAVPPTVFGQSFGTLDLTVAATVEGPDGNVGAGQIAGVWNNTLNYTNSALQGGSVDTIKVVKQEDIDGLAAELRAKVENRAASTVLGMANSGQQLITQTIALTDATFTPDHKAGEDGDSVHVKFTAQAQAYAYKDSELRDSVAQAMLDSVQSTIPSTVGPNLDLGSVQYTPPSLQAREAGRVVYRTSASGRVTFALTPELASQIRTLVKGKAISQARNLIQQNYAPYLSPDSIKAKVLWFSLNTLPTNPAHIDVQPTGGRSLP